MPAETFTSFNPLDIKLSSDHSDVTKRALMREIKNILGSYVGRYDAFCELVQNSLDAVETRQANDPHPTYKPRVEVFINIDANTLTVSDNGIGLEEDEYRLFLAPNYSFKDDDGPTRGRKGVGATYLAYGFDYMRASTKTPNFNAAGEIKGARTWVHSKTDSTSFPLVVADTKNKETPFFDSVDRGVSVTVGFNENTTLRELRWLKAYKASTWMKILSVKTAIGAVTPKKNIEIIVRVLANGVETTDVRQEIGYLWLHDFGKKPMNISTLRKVADDSYNRYGAGRRLAAKYYALDLLYGTWEAAELADIMTKQLREEHAAVLLDHSPTVQMDYGYSAKLWSSFNEALDVRAGQQIVKAGIQLAANGMPQGEVIQVPLLKNIGRQNQVHFLIHFDNYTPDLGRKGFARELVDFATDVARLLIERQVARFASHMKENTGVAPDLVRSTKIDEWKKSMLEHEEKNPLELTSSHFFAPTKKISITSKPSREQDVIALFHELVSGGVIRGISTLATNESFTYDGLFRVSFAGDDELFLYDSEINPLGVTEELIEEMSGKVTEPRVMEYKFSLDGLIADVASGDKNLSDIDLCVAWETGTDFKERFQITTFLLPENCDSRQFHGVTHMLSDIETGSRHCDLIILSELVDALVDPGSAESAQREKYED